MLLIIAVTLVVLWLLGLLGHVGGGYIHILLIAAVVIIIYHFLRGRKAA
jgi:4-hydroxybenzoate polyprenyltransferase